jgi:outer membrane immunogenic protein
MRCLSLAIIGAGLLAMSSSSAFASSIDCLPPFTGSNSASASSVVGGAQLGYNWQRGSFVYGLETDISAMDPGSQKTTVSQILPPAACDDPVLTANTNANVNWYGTFRGRIGWSSGPILFYGTGGLAYGRVELNSSLNFSSPGFSASLNDQTSSVKAGWVAGAGIEYALRPNVFLNLGYQYVDLGTISLADTTRIGPIILTQSASAHAQFSVVTFGISWRFAPIDTSPQGPWEGAYFGGHIGGAWGNRANDDYSFQPIITSDIRLKRDIALVARLDDGLGLYRYRYLWSDTVYVGVMAQEVALDHPDAVVRDPFGYLLVDYSKLGIKLMTLSEWNARS